MVDIKYGTFKMISLEYKPNQMQLDQKESVGSKDFSTFLLIVRNM